MKESPKSSPSTGSGDAESRSVERPQYSVVIPFFNEQDCVLSVLEEVRSVMDRLGQPYEVIAVDDGSSDRTSWLITQTMRGFPQLWLKHWEQNRGQAAALLFGLRQARAPIVITMDGDGQNDPEDIPSLLGALDEVDMVVGIRVNRHDSTLRRWMSRVANAVRGRFLGDHLHDSGCALKVFRREVVESFVPLRTLYSFIPALAIAGGSRVAEAPVNHRPRLGGTSSYGLRKMLWLPALDMLGVYWLINRRSAPILKRSLDGHIG